MPKFQVYGRVEGSTYIGEYEAPDAETAKELAENDAWVNLCHQCSGSCEDPVVTVTDAVGEDE